MTIVVYNKNYQGLLVTTLEDNEWFRKYSQGNPYRLTTLKVSRDITKTSFELYTPYRGEIQEIVSVDKMSGNIRESSRFRLAYINEIQEV